MFVRDLIRKAKALLHARKPILHSTVSGVVIALSFGYLIYILARNWSELASYEWQIDYSQAALVFVSYSLTLALAVVGWGLVMGRLTSVRDPRKHLKYYIYTNLLRRLPAPLLYLFGRVYLYEQEGIAKSVVVTISFLEWILIVLSGIVVYILIQPFLLLPSAWRSPWFLVGVLVASVLLLRPRTIRAILHLFNPGELPMSFGYRDVLVWLVVYGLVWVGGGLMLYATINSLYVLPLVHLPTVIGAWILSGLVTTLVFVTSAGLGLKEITLGFLLSYVMPSPLAIIVALLMRVCLTLFEIIWGVIALKL